MRVIFIKMLLLLLCVCAACKQSTPHNDFNVTPNLLETNFKEWWTYHSINIKLSSNFVALDDGSKRISKASFLSKVGTGNYMPLKVKRADDSLYYKLYKLGNTSDSAIRDALINTTAIHKKHFSLENTKFPEFNFKDLDGKLYKNALLKGKIVVVKCWFIACKPCIEEMDELNQLVEKYSNNQDIVFLSLARDSESQLSKFLAHRDFKYAVIANQEEYLSETLNVQLFPTHYIINTDGTIHKIVNTAEELMIYLKAFVQNVN